MQQTVKSHAQVADTVSGEFLTMDDERYYVIRNVDRIAPFFMNVVSSSDHWLFVSSAGGISAGRISPDHALFPYVPVDRIHEAHPHTGSKTLFRVHSNGLPQLWEPFTRQPDDQFSISRNLYKSVLSNKLCFEEINHTLQLTFRYSWNTSDRYGFVRSGELLNSGDAELRVEVLDGLQNVLPASTPRRVQANASNLVDAYRWSELDTATGLAIFSVYSGISDRAEPSESLKANTVFCIALDDHKVLLTSDQLDVFRAGGVPVQEDQKRGTRGAFFASATLAVPTGQSRSWQIVANVEQSQSQVVALRLALRNPGSLADSLAASVLQGSDELARIMASADGFQATAEEMVSAHHYANVLFNTLRGGIFDDQYKISSPQFRDYIRHFNLVVYERNREFLDSLPEKTDYNQLRSDVRDHGDAQLARLCYEYLPVTFGRRHGDPSRPWNHFSIRIQDDSGYRRLYYEGNWRDIFQNWEALAVSYPDFIESMIAKFVNASTMDGYNPYRITSEGIDWEIEEPDNPWGAIGYWGDHQVIYLLKFLELSRLHHPTRIAQLLRRPIFSYANVPYRIQPFEALLADPKNTVVYDPGVADRIGQRVERIGADGKLIADPEGSVYQVTLLEKLLVPLLAKLGNFVPDGGIWLNTQRPEWNDANNALVGNGASMVTLCYMRRYVRFLRELLATESRPVDVSCEVFEWLTETSAALRRLLPALGDGPVSPARRFEALQEFGVAACRYRSSVYDREGFSGTTELSIPQIEQLLEDALVAIDHSIRTNRRKDGLYHAYNLLAFEPDAVEIDSLYPMLEGQVAALSSGAISPGESCDILESLFDSEIFRADQDSFMLYPDRELPGFLEKNRVPADAVGTVPLLCRMIEDGDERVILQDAVGTFRFNADFQNSRDLESRLDEIRPDYGADIDKSRDSILALYEQVFNHRAFTGRSGTMFAFEGLGSVYWHMVSKLLLAAQEVLLAAMDDDADDAVVNRLGRLYYRIRNGLGFNKTPLEYGAFPMDPYSHTPKHAGARQPGMTGLVKEEILTRFGELGIRVLDGVIRIDPSLLRPSEFTTDSSVFQHLDLNGDWREISLSPGALAFTWCQVPFVYQLDDDADPALTVTDQDGMVQTLPSLELPADVSAMLIARSGDIRQITAVLPSRFFFNS